MIIKLTGQTRFRVAGGWFRSTKLILQVQEYRKWGPIVDTFLPDASSDAGESTDWRDARVEDIAFLNLGRVEGFGTV